MSFENIYRRYDWEETLRTVYGKTEQDVRRALFAKRRTLDDFAALISPAAAPFLQEMASQSRLITQRRFGKTMQLYIPLYLSNECQNICTYCGFSLNNPIRRKTLSAGEILQEVNVIRQLGFEHVLLVTGEAQQTVGMDYFRRALPLIRPHFAQVSMEVQPLDEPDYAELAGLGLHAVLVYQETYHEAAYRTHHPKGKKSNFSWRLETPDRLGRAGVHKIGLGVLIGLEDWRTDSFFTALHLDYLQRTYWQTRYSVSFPRLRPFSGGLAPKVPMSDRELLQLICAWRLWQEDIELSLSTRESPQFRDLVATLGVTAMSAGSRTNPGGYAADQQSLEQFEIHDDRSPADIAAMLREQGYEAVWKDWADVLRFA
ncbi:2-iminoacetate synthase ThiH [Chitinophaga lutea]